MTKGVGATDTYQFAITPSLTLPIEVCTCRAIAVACRSSLEPNQTKSTYRPRSNYRYDRSQANFGFSRGREHGRMISARAYLDRLCKSRGGRRFAGVGAGRKRAL